MYNNFTVIIKTYCTISIFDHTLFRFGRLDRYSDYDVHDTFDRDRQDQFAIFNLHKYTSDVNISIGQKYRWFLHIHWRIVPLNFSGCITSPLTSVAIPCNIYIFEHLPFIYQYQIWTKFLVQSQNIYGTNGQFCHFHRIV